MLARPRALLPLLALMLIGAGVLAVLARGGGDARDASAASAAQATSTPTATPTPAPVAAPVEDHLVALGRVAAANGDTRAAGTPGDRASVDYVVGRLRATGYAVSLQRFSFPYFDELAPPRIEVAGDRLRRADGLSTLRFSGAGRVSGRVRPAGLEGSGPSAAGCSPRRLPALRRGEIALLGRGACTLRRKALTAQRAGAAAVLIANDGAAGERRSFPGTLGRPGIRVPVVGVSRRIAWRVAAAGRARMTVRTASEARSTVNVVAERPGRRTGPLLMAGGHLDSVAAGPGLNDNASGVAALLSSAERLARTEPAPGAASVRFAFWGAEELGLLGSRRYVAGLSSGERRRLRGYVNLDMVGSPRPRPVTYGSGGGALEAGLRRAWRATGVTPGQTNLGGSSDHAAFARAGIPVAGLFTGASESTDPCYHRACDDADNVDLPSVRAAAQALEAALRSLREDPPAATGAARARRG